MKSQSDLIKWLVTLCALFLFWSLIIFIFPGYVKLNIVTQFCCGVMVYVLPLEIFGYDLFKWEVVNNDCLWNRFINGIRDYFLSYK